jgi:hypothetical protein
MLAASVRAGRRSRAEIDSNRLRDNQTHLRAIVTLRSVLPVLPEPCRDTHGWRAQNFPVTFSRPPPRRQPRNRHQTPAFQKFTAPRFPSLTRQHMLTRTRSYALSRSPDWLSELLPAAGSIQYNTSPWWYRTTAPPHWRYGTGTAQMRFGTE